MIMAFLGVTYPAAGVITTNPCITENPSVVFFVGGGGGGFRSATYYNGSRRGTDC